MQDSKHQSKPETVTKIGQLKKRLVHICNVTLSVSTESFLSSFFALTAFYTNHVKFSTDSSENPERYKSHLLLFLETTVTWLLLHFLSFLLVLRIFTVLV